MSYQDKSIQCSDCGTVFTFTAEEQEQFAVRGYRNSPKRCPECRMARKSRQNEANGGRTADTFTRQMFHATCANCGKETEVPFKPRTDRPVYCRDCYSRVRSSG